MKSMSDRRRRFIDIFVAFGRFIFIHNQLMGTKRRTTWISLSFWSRSKLDIIIVFRANAEQWCHLRTVVCKQWQFANLFASKFWPSGQPMTERLRRYVVRLAAARLRMSSVSVQRINHSAAMNIDPRFVKISAAADDRRQGIKSSCQNGRHP